MKKFKPVFYYLAFANFTCFMGLSFFTLFPIFMKQIGATQAQIGLIFNVDRLLVVMTAIGIASFIRIKDKIQLLRIGYLILTITFLCYMLISSFSWYIMILRITHGIGFSISLILGTTIIFDIVPIHKAAEAIGIFGVTGAITNAISPFIGELLISRGYSFYTLFLISTSLALTSFCVTFIMPKAECQRDIPENERQGFMHLFGNIRFNIILAVALIFGGGFGAILTFLPNFILSTTKFQFSYFFIAYIFILVIIRFRIIGMVSKFNKNHLLLFMFALGAIMNAGMNFIYSSAILILLGVIYGMIHGILYPVLNTIAVSLVSHHDRGKANALFTGSFNAGMIVFCLPMGLLIDYTGTYLAAFNINSTAFVAGIGLILFSTIKYGPFEITKEVPVNIE